MKTTQTKTPPQWKFEDSRAGMRESMSTPHCAQMIDRETGAAELLAALESIARELTHDFGKAIPNSLHTARQAIAKHNARTS